MNILISGCLLGLSCRYDGKSKGIDEALIEKLKSKHTLIPACPEQLGGLPTPRPPAERVDNSVLTAAGGDVTEQYLRGAEEAAALCKLLGCEAAVLKDMMTEVVTSGTGTAAAVSGVTVAGKTGTAENATGNDHSWFIGFAPAEDPKVAVAVLIENSNYGSATPIAGQMIRAALNELGE